LFSITVTGKSIQLELSGSVDLSSTQALKEEFEQVMSSDITAVRVNAQGLDYIDSSGVASLLFVRKLCTRFGAQMVFESVSDKAARVIQLANLDAVLGLPKSAATVGHTATTQDSHRTRAAEPQFSDADAMAIFKDSPPSQAPSKGLSPGEIDIKPPSFS
jgi:anti-sigma B factor antagonist